MIQKLKSWLWNNISGGLSADSDLEMFRKMLLLNLIFILGSIFLAILCIVAFIQKDFILCTADFTILLFLVSLFFYLRKSKRLTPISIIGTVATGIFYFFLIAYGGINKTAFVWSFTYPLISLFLLGIRLGTLTSFSLLGMACIVFALAPMVSFFTSYDTNLIVRFIPAYITVHLFALAMEKIREIAQSKLNTSNIELEAINKKLAQEIEDHLRSEKDLRESEIKFHSLFDFSPQAIAVSDVETGRLVDVNSKFCELTKYTKEEILGQTTTALDFFTEEWRAKFLDELMATGEIQGMEVDVKDKVGSIMTAIAFSKFIKLAGKDFIITICLDITERKILENQLQQVQKMEAIGTLAGGIAHDFNNLLMSIQGKASVILYDLDKDHVLYDQLKSIEQLIQSGSKVTNQILGFAREGKIEVKPADLNKLINNSFKMFGTARKELKIHTKFQENIWTVEIDQNQIDQVLLNLFVNASQAMPKGGDLYIHTENTALDKAYVKPHLVQPGKFVKISITDTGCGMDETVLQKVFDPFFTTREVGQGTGLGLASSYGIIKNHNGFINVYSEKGIGSTFSIYLPTTKKHVVDAIKPQAKIIKGTGTILFIDDEERILKTSKEMLEALGYTVLFATEGKGGIETYQDNNKDIDLVILDMILPGMDGNEIYDQLKGISPDVKVLLSSGYSQNGQAAEILDKGCNGFIQKPFTLEQISQKIYDILNT